MTFKQEVKTYLGKIKQESGCSLCNETHPACLDFHHRDPSTKRFAISDFFKLKPSRFADLLDELKKCDVVCVRCHRRLHYKG